MQNARDELKRVGSSCLQEFIRHHGVMKMLVGAWGGGESFEMSQKLSANVQPKHNQE